MNQQNDKVIQGYIDNRNVEGCFRLKVGSKRSSCITAIAINTLDMDLCEKADLEGTLFNVNCMNDITIKLDDIKNLDVDFCLGLNSSTTRSVCLFSVAIENLDIDLCNNENIKGLTYQKRCREDILKQLNKDNSVVDNCLRYRTNETRILCLSNLAKNAPEYEACRKAVNNDTSFWNECERFVLQQRKNETKVAIK